MHEADIAALRVVPDPQDPEIPAIPGGLGDPPPIQCIDPATGRCI
jgi:hypothetical protein